MPPGDCEILRPFCCPADGAAMGAAAPGRDMGKESKEGAPCPPPACVVSVLFVCWAACPGAAAPMAARGSLICVRSGFCSQIRDSQRFVTIFNV